MWVGVEHLPVDRNKGLWFSIYEPRPTLSLLVFRSFVFENLQPPPTIHQNRNQLSGKTTSTRREEVQEFMKERVCNLRAHSKTSFGIVKKKKTSKSRLTFSGWWLGRGFQGVTLMELLIWSMINCPSFLSPFSGPRWTSISDVPRLEKAKVYKLFSVYSRFWIAKATEFY